MLCSGIHNYNNLIDGCFFLLCISVEVGSYPITLTDSTTQSHCPIQTVCDRWPGSCLQFCCTSQCLYSSRVCMADGGMEVYGKEGLLLWIYQDQVAGCCVTHLLV